MFLLPVSPLKELMTPKHLVPVALVAAILWLVSVIYAQHGELVKAREVYDHPNVRVVYRTITKEGPIRIKTVIREVPGGAKETTIEEDRAEVTTDTGNQTTTEIVPIAVALAPARTDRYLLSIGANRLSQDLDGKALFVGYGFKNRLDLQVGGIVHDGFSPWIFATIRF